MEITIFTQMLIGAGMVVLTVFLHALALDRLMAFLESFAHFFFRFFKNAWKSSVLVFTVLLIFCSHVLHIWLWTALYLYLGSFSDLESALYFSTSTFTTVGYGDVLLDKNWRLLGSFQSANGFILFGWSTAYIFEVTSKLYRNDVIDEEEK